MHRRGERIGGLPVALDLRLEELASAALVKLGERLLGQADALIGAGKLGGGALALPVQGGDALAEPVGLELILAREGGDALGLHPSALRIESLGGGVRLLPLLEALG
jgi:hypothetical protein